MLAGKIPDDEAKTENKFGKKGVCEVLKILKSATADDKNAGVPFQRSFGEKPVGIKKERDKDQQ